MKIVILIAVTVFSFLSLLHADNDALKLTLDHGVEKPEITADHFDTRTPEEKNLAETDDRQAVDAAAQSLKEAQKAIEEETTKSESTIENEKPASVDAILKADEADAKEKQKEESEANNTTQNLDDILAEPLPQGDDFTPDHSLLIDPGIPSYEENQTKTDHLSVTPPPQPKFKLKDQIRFRQIRTQALKNSEIQEAWIKSEHARTDVEKRAALDEYYTLLFKRMKAIDRTVVEQFEEVEKKTFSAITQKRVAPSTISDIKRETE